LKKAEDAEVDTAEQSAIKLRSQQQTSSALVLADHPPVNGSAPAANHLTLVKIPSQNIAEV
jgi:AP-2 complex subunit alpha